jgi:hypothetical protein
MRARLPRRGVAAATLVAVALSLTLTATAQAWRKPTASERRAITRAASTTPHAGNSKVRVSRIRVSTAGPWASATLTIVVGGVGDNATAILRKVRGKWRSAGVGTAGEECVMPLKDRRNLGFGPYPCR